MKNEKSSDMIISNLLDHIRKEIHSNNLLSDVSNDPSFYLGKIHALQDIQSKILKLLINKMNKKILILLECEGIILQLEKLDNKLYFNFRDDKHKISITEEEIRKFLNGELTIELPSGKLFDIKNYTSTIQYKQEDLEQFLKNN
jgi:hypothetical protein